MPTILPCGVVYAVHVSTGTGDLPMEELLECEHDGSPRYVVSTHPESNCPSERAHELRPELKASQIVKDGTS